MAVEDHIKRRSDESSSNSQASTVRAGGNETGGSAPGGEKKSVNSRTGIESASRKVSGFKDRAAESGEAVGRAVRDTLFRRQRRSAGLKMAGVEFPDLLEAEAGPGLVRPESVLIPQTALRSERADSGSGDARGEGAPGRAAESEGDDSSQTDPRGTGDILPPPSSQPPTAARRVASGVVLVAIAVGIGLLLSIAFVMAVAWASTTLIDYFRT